METEEMTLELAQKEVGEWALRNFDEQGSYRPLLGLMEEMGEYCEARDIKNVAKMRDAIGDMGIYMLHYCYIRGWSMSELWDGRVGPTGPFMSAVKTLCHSQLKGEQNIRGGSAKHDFILRNELSNLLWRMDQAAIDVGTDCLVLIYNTWELVKQRDWKKNPNNADKVAEITVSSSPVTLAAVAEEDARFLAHIDAAVEESRCSDTLRPEAAQEQEDFEMFKQIELASMESHRNTVTDG